MSCKKFDKFPVDFHWKDMVGCLSLFGGLFLAAVTLNIKKDPTAVKQETVVSMAEKSLQSIVLPQTTARESDKSFVGPPLPPDIHERNHGNIKSPQNFMKQVLNKKFSVY